MRDTLHRLFRFKAWADDELFDSLAKLDGGSPVISLAVKALSHTYVVDRIFFAHMTRKAHRYTSANPSQLPTLEALSRDMRTSDREYVDYVAELQSGELRERIDFTFTDGAPGCMSREEMLLHVITHGVGHRGQVSAVMLLNSLPAATDGFTTYLHRAEGAMRGRAPQQIEAVQRLARAV
jgi:uncharacterized damage-inducible protein DinB